jgi:tRNA pseudouridine38-40 synthase
MMRFRIDIAYDGTPFEGWQSQREGSVTIQTTIEKAVSTLVKKQTKVIGAGRTDAGVHARCQTAHFDVEAKMSGLAFQRGLNSLLPPAIRILDCHEVEPTFHSRFSALARVYYYYLVNSEFILPWEHPWNVKVSRIPPLTRLNAMADLLHGELDFTTFSHAKDPSASRERFIYHASWFPLRDRLVFKIAGNAFLWRMVRSLVGTMLELGKNENARDSFKKALEARDRAFAGPTAPAKGLFLHKVVYDAREFSS